MKQYKGFIDPHAEGGISPTYFLIALYLIAWLLVVFYGYKNEKSQKENMPKVQKISLGE